MKSTLKATNDGKTLSSVYIIELQKNGNDIYIRKYTIMTDKSIVCFDLNGNNDKKTELKSLENIVELKAYDNQFYGGEFS